jgi:regulator of protease activity HflC (stomatin/prohibitin superfamily)
MSLKQGEAAVLQNSFNGKSKGIVEGPKLVMKSPFTSARRYVSEKFNPESGSFSEGEDSSRISIRERLFEIPSNTATTSDGVEVDYVLRAVLQVKDAEKFISVSENPLATVVRNLIRAATPLFKGKTLDDIRSDRSEMEEEAIKKVQTLADKYGI